MTDRVRLANVAIVLHRPRFAENIGSAARAMKNMGIGRLIVISPEDDDRTRMLRLATHAAADIIDAMQVADDLPSALAPFRFVVGTTARMGKQRHMLLSPPQLAEKLVTITRHNQAALVFGPEDRGLTNEDLRSCHLLVNIPTASFTSLNLAQAVMVMCYELQKAGLASGSAPTPRLATRHELDGMYDQLKEILVRIDYIQPDNPDYWINKLRHFFTRLQLRAGEVSIIRGIIRQVNWYAGKRYRDGLNDGQAGRFRNKR